ncbi:MAG: YihY/virulence factor BrkB family protein [Ignavibacteria bacterium]|nr:YihY/virulence factor BrkB family protein [Ignavibacteria bacterium]
MFKLKEKIKTSGAYKSFRKIRFSLHLIPSFKKVKEFSKHYFGGIYNRVDTHHVFLLAGGLAFSLFVCIIPFVLIIFAVLGNFLDSEAVQFQISTLIDTIIPYRLYSDFVKAIIFKRIEEFIEYKTIAGIVGGFGLLFASSGLFSSMRTILNRVFGVETDVNIIIGKLRDFALVLMVLLIFFVTTVSMPFLNLIFQFANAFEFLGFLRTGYFEYLLLSLISFSLIYIVFAILYLAVPVKKVGRKTVFISAFWAAILWEAAKQLFEFYITNYAAYGKIYGAYALIVVVAFWIYYSSVVFIIGAEIGRLYYERNYITDETESV